MLFILNDQIRQYNKLARVISDNTVRMSIRMRYKFDTNQSEDK